MKYIKYFILDEADEMLNLGFRDDIKFIIEAIRDKTKYSIQYIMFSATIPYDI